MEQNPILGCEGTVCYRYSVSLSSVTKTAQHLWAMGEQPAAALYTSCAAALTLDQQ